MKPERINLEEYLSQYPEEMNIIARNLRNLILEIVPDMDENIKWKNLFYEKNGFICAIVIHGDHVNLEFARGTELEDPYRMLEGTGKKIRHMKIHNSDEIKSNEIKKMLLEAVDLNIKRK
jgi:hypothetical protein